MKSIENKGKQVILDINKNVFTDLELVQIFELVVYKLGIKTISNYAKLNNMSYNGVKKFRGKISIDGINFVCDKIKPNNLPF